MSGRVARLLQFVAGSAFLHLVSAACSGGQARDGVNRAAADDDIVAIDCSTATAETVNGDDYLYVLVDRAGRSDSKVAHASLVDIDPAPRSIGGRTFERFPVTQRFAYSRDMVWIACGDRDERYELHF